MNFDTMIAEYRDYKDLEVFSRSQFATIVELSKKLQKLEEENGHLKELLEKTNPLQINGNNSIVAVDLDSSDSEIIARTQLALLKSMSMSSELSLEETRKAEIFTNILLSLKKDDKESETRAAPIDTATLLAALENKDDTQPA